MPTRVAVLAAAVTILTVGTMFLVGKFYLPSGHRFQTLDTVDVEIANVRRLIVARRPYIAHESDLKKAMLLADMVHHAVAVENVPWVHFSDLDWTFHSAMEGKQGHLCQGITFVYMTALRAFGIESRFIGRFEKNAVTQPPVTSHASTEVLIDGRWIAIDPTFHFTIRNMSGERIGWLEAREEHFSGYPIAFIDEGASPNHSFMAQYGGNAGFVGVLNLMSVGPSRVSDSDRRPGEWDGMIRYDDGSPTSNVIHFSGVYERIAHRGKSVAQ